MKSSLPSNSCRGKTDSNLSKRNLLIDFSVCAKLVCTCGISSCIFGKESKISGRVDLVKKLGKSYIALPNVTSTLTIGLTFFAHF